MSDARHTASLDLTRFKAALFDLDGVVTKTATVHALAWQQLFNDYLHSYSQRTGRPLSPLISTKITVSMWMASPVMKG